MDRSECSVVLKNENGLKALEMIVCKEGSDKRFWVEVVGKEVGLYKRGVVIMNLVPDSYIEIVRKYGKLPYEKIEFSDIVSVFDNCLVYYLNEDLMK